jgi:AraC-like DNA-binding protein
MAARLEHPQARPSRSPARTKLAGGEGWSIAEYVCCSGPDDRPFEERHERFAIVAVAEGSFRYRTDQGEALLYPGALMLGNAGAAYECGHEHGVGDRCICVHYAPALFEEIAAGSRRQRFGAAMLPALPSLAALTVAVERVASGPAEAAAAEALAFALAEKVTATAAGEPSAQRGPKAADARRVSAVLREIEADAASPLDLGAMALRAGMSPYHFLRTFRRLTGVTPYRYVLELRLRRAAACIADTREPISAIAFDEGFGDLSTFNGRFRRTFSMTPSAYRAAYGRRSTLATSADV